MKPQDVEQQQYDLNTQQQYNKLKTLHSNLKEKFKANEDIIDKKNKEITILKRLLTEAKKTNKFNRDTTSALREIEIKPAPTSKLRLSTNTAVGRYILYIYVTYLLTNIS